MIDTRASPALPERGETRDLLRAALRELHGPAARLEDWTEDRRFTRYGKRRVVRYEVWARVAGLPHVRRYRWVGKIYERDADARRVAAVLRQLARRGAGEWGAPAVPGVLAYDARRRLLLLTYETGEPVIAALGHETAAVLAALGRALAALHATPAPVSLDSVTSPAAVLGELRPMVADLCQRLPSQSASLRCALSELERNAPPAPAATSLVHGDFGPANLLWRGGHIIVLDFDRCTRGDPALDLGNLLAQMRRVWVRNPDALVDFASARRSVLDAYRGASSPAARARGLGRRVAWYERATLLRKIHRLTFDTTQYAEGEAMRRREAEALRAVSLRSPCDRRSRRDFVRSS
ncbi:MAG TPA: aminoglycoside phosphotransferase family protein [Gemmatimonadales bacterium]